MAEESGLRRVVIVGGGFKLPYLRTHLTADMIAKRLFISIHTVKSGG
jgi:uridylate kinase